MLSLVLSLFYFSSCVLSGLASRMGMERKQNAVEFYLHELLGLLYNAELEYTGDAAFGGSYTYIEAICYYC